MEARNPRKIVIELLHVPFSVLVLVLLSILMMFPTLTASATEQDTRKRKQTTVSVPSEDVTPPGIFKTGAPHVLTHKNYVITLQAYSYNPLGWDPVSSVKIERLPKKEVLYHEFGVPPPVPRDPMAVFEQKKGPALLCILTFLELDKANSALLRVYELEYPYNQIPLRVSAHKPFNIRDHVGDLDGDGCVEVLTTGFKVAGSHMNMERGAEPGTLFVYRYVPGPGTDSEEYGPSQFPCFKRVKGRAFKRFFMDQASYIYNWISKEKERDELERLILNWLATIESTQNPALIKEALRRFKAMSRPDAKGKERILKLLIKDGYSMLKEDW
jgi:hypothetical protein